MNKHIHQIFLPITDKTMADYGYDVNHALWKEWADKNGWGYTLHDWDSIEKLKTSVDKDYSAKAKSEKRSPFIDVDWGKYIVLNTLGGVYVDLDVRPTSKSLEYFQRGAPLISTWKHPTKTIYRTNTQVIGFNKGDLDDLLEYCYKEYDVKREKEVYDTWRVRFYFQVAGPNVFNRWAKSKGIEKTRHLDFNDFFVDEQSGAWKKQ